MSFLGFTNIKMHSLPSNIKNSFHLRLISLTFTLMPSLVPLVAPKSMKANPSAELSVRQLVNQPFRQSKQPRCLPIAIMRHSSSNLYLSSVCHFDLICLHDHFRNAIPHHQLCIYNISKYNLNVVWTRVPKIYVWYYF